MRLFRPQGIPLKRNWKGCKGQRGWKTPAIEQGSLNQLNEAHISSKRLKGQA